MLRHSLRFVLLAFGLCVLVGSSGCGSSVPTDVSGTIKLRGQAPNFTGIQVVFMRPDGNQVAAPVSENGSYKASGVPSGEVKVCFAYITPEAAQAGAEFKASGGGRLKKPGDSEAPKVKAPGTPGPATNPIPMNLRDTSTSNLTFKVEAGKPNTFDFDIPAN
jgi:hypothetical protein